jgi:hypothetical protein
MTVRALCLIGVIATGLLAACGGAGSPGAGATGAPRFTPIPVSGSPTPSGDPYDYGY